MGKWYQCHMQMWINCINICNTGIQKIMWCNWIISFLPCIIQCRLSCAPLTAEPRLKLIWPSLPNLLNFLMSSFKHIWLSNSFHIHYTWSLCWLGNPISQLFQSFLRSSSNLCLSLLELQQQARQHSLWSWARSLWWSWLTHCLG